MIIKKINILKAHHGDCCIIEAFYTNGNPYIILIDGGPRENYRTSLVHDLDQYKKIDLIILTHIDSDHIGGLLEYLSSSIADKHEFDKIIINAPNLLTVNQEGTQISIDEGVKFEKVLKEKRSNIEVIGNITSESDLNEFLPDGIEIKILSPNDIALKELYANWPEYKKSDNDTQVSTEVTNAKDFDIELNKLALNKDVEKSIKNDFVNASSIAFSIKTINFHGLFMGDAHSSIISESLSKLYSEDKPVFFDYIKLSHHGSKYNISNTFLDRIICFNCIISTNGGSGRSKHPDRQTIAKIIHHKNMQKDKVKFYFNYPIATIEKKTGKLFKEEELELFEAYEQNQINI
ncbi:MBL fold metallo-hydrolase [Olleya sp. HaHaR_3_96]|uniref:MBL fold metallo-hydrolase n=1 Tax=Olleya sp. HaHaR_3_96 TaxID=2745560 RepID=UPI001C4F4F75|nr:MBL fold metallo-hydrolase [Olleya sp. HaHaR_3_96]QXP58816.1 MBL fold metallo-hydrolase [Olleya sp. HaHaR_3_96]